MNKTDVISYLADKVELINHFLNQAIPKGDIPNDLKEGMEYSLFAGGKRIRPILSLATYEAFGKDCRDIVSIASNIELLHTYSLIHDDLPSMDNDDYRRGKLTNHKVFGEALAILAGDALLTHSFGNMAQGLRSFENISTDNALKILEEFALYSGALGMVGGQVVDLQANQTTASFDDLVYIHTHKTGDLIVFSIRLGAILAGASSEQLEALTQFGRQLGLAFQIQDDILDIIGDSKKLGKNVGSDLTNNKVTYPYFKGIDISKDEVLKLTSEAKKSIENIGIETKYLYSLADFLIYREK